MKKENQNLKIKISGQYDIDLPLTYFFIEKVKYMKIGARSKCDYFRTMGYECTLYYKNITNM